MTTAINMALYRILVRQGASETEAEEAARLVANDLATKGDLLELKAELFKHTTQTLAWFTGIVALLLSAIMTIFRFLEGR
jgi:hypothetical protein